MTVRTFRTFRTGRAQGFTLLELLIAVAVFAVVAVTVYTRSGDTLVQLQVLEQRTMASWIAQNELALARIRQVANPEPVLRDHGKTGVARRLIAIKRDL